MIRALALASFLAVAFAGPPVHATTDGDDCFCHGCGCKGGPGYRDEAGHCVGWKQLAKKCGEPPTSRCKEEKAAVVCDRGGRPEKAGAPESERPKIEPVPRRQPPLSTPHTTTRPSPF